MVQAGRIRRARWTWTGALVLSSTAVIWLGYWTVSTSLEVRDLRLAVEARAGALGKLQRDLQGLDTDLPAAMTALCDLGRELRTTAELEANTREAASAVVDEACEGASSAGARAAGARLTVALRTELSQISTRLGGLWDRFYVLSLITVGLAALALALLTYLRFVVLQAIKAEVAELREYIGDAERLALVGTLAAGAAHEINNPLTFVMGNLQFVESQLEGQPALAEERQALADAVEGVRRVRGIVRDLQDAGRPVDDPPEPCDLEATIDRALAIASVGLPKDLEVVRELGQLPRVMAPPPRLEQVLINIFTNAAYAMAEAKTPQRLHVRAERRGPARLRLEITDTGPGFPPAVLARPFEPFNTTKPAGEGTGLGLFVSHRIARAFGAELSIANVETGARVSLELDLAP